MKVIIAGGRDFNKGKIVIDEVAEFVRLHGEITEIVCGMAKGADMMGWNYGRIWNIPVKEFPANWALYGKSAGYKRNEEMAKYANALIAFWDGKSRGTHHMINLAHDHNLIVTIAMY